MFASAKLRAGMKSSTAPRFARTRTSFVCEPGAPLALSSARLRPDRCLAQQAPEADGELHLMSVCLVSAGRQGRFVFSTSTLNSGAPESIIHGTRFSSQVMRHIQCVCGEEACTTTLTSARRQSHNVFTLPCGKELPSTAQTNESLQKV
ncbi:hypothetical protein F2P81_015686 [Scophthalmus maximus]|uniref:Uncharacterized protein n=1 Tax=Scophthalmus maximus TaxID=52904 RepID=A0A6A4SJ31_SCOMX|nr:hypothetical protein F2P81_015686 [Scophthalmus maximus]